MLKIVILTYESYQANLITCRLLKEFPGQVVKILKSNVIVPKKNLWQSFWFLYRKSGLGFVARKGWEINLYLIVTRLCGFMGKKLKIPSLSRMGTNYKVQVLSVKNINFPEVIDTLKGLQFDLIISVYLNQKIGGQLIKIAPKGVINIHPSLLPKNRGLFPYFWVLANGDNETGVTVHWVDSKFDTGDILIQRALPVTSSCTVFSLSYECAKLGADLLVEAVKLVEKGSPPKISQNKCQSSYFSWPSPIDVCRFKKKGRKYGSILEIWRELFD